MTPLFQRLSVLFLSLFLFGCSSTPDIPPFLPMAILPIVVLFVSGVKTATTSRSISAPSIRRSVAVRVK